jgi:hypothetical protein
MTQQTKYLRSFEALTTRYHDWGLVRDAPSSELEALLADASVDTQKRPWMDT